MIDYLQAFILAVIQGITEWLPVSSSGHLAIAQNLLGVSPPVMFDIMLHIGTLLAVIIYFRNDILLLIRGFLTFNLQNKDFQYCILMVVASIPTAIIGFAFHDFFASSFSNMPQVALELAITGVAIYSCRLITTKTPKIISVPIAFFVGIAQGISVAPGISRSGFTISAGMLAGLDKESAARFSFLISIPALIGAALFEFRVLDSGSWDAIAGPSIFGAVIAAAIGYLSIGFLLDVIRKGYFSIFAYYCWALALIILLMTYL